MQNVAICLGIDQDVKSALASANGAAQVQSIAASVVGAVAKLSARQLQPEEPDSRQRGPHALVRHIYPLFNYESRAVEPPTCHPGS